MVKMNVKSYWYEAVRNWGSGVKREHWSPSNDSRMSYRLRMETFRAAARYM